MLEVTLRDRKINIWVRNRTKVKDGMAVIARKKALDMATIGIETQSGRKRARQTATALNGRSSTTRRSGLDENEKMEDE